MTASPFNGGASLNNAYDVYAYLLNADTGSTTELLDSHGDATTSWSTVTHTVAADASYYFVFAPAALNMILLAASSTHQHLATLSQRRH